MIHEHSENLEKMNPAEKQAGDLDCRVHGKLSEAGIARPLGG